MAIGPRSPRAPRRSRIIKMYGMDVHPALIVPTTVSSADPSFRIRDFLRRPAPICPRGFFKAGRGEERAEHGRWQVPSVRG